jgi:hypothetical protein
LEISQVFVGATVSSLVKFYAFLYLLFDGLLGTAIGRVEGLVAAEGAASHADFSIPVGTAEVGVDADLLHPSAELLRKIAAVTVETAFVAPGIGHGSE